MGLLKYVFQSAWREIGLMAKLLWMVGWAIPTFLATLAGRTNIPLLGWLANLLPWWGWLAIAGAVAFIGLFIAVSKRAYRLENQIIPALTCNDITIWNNGKEDFIRVQLENLSTIDVNGVKPYLDNIEADDALRELKTIDFRLPLYSQERLRERFASGPKANPPRPINFSARQRKWIELFQVSETLHRLVHVMATDGRKNITSLPIMYFKYSVYGIPNPIEFTVTYEEVGDGWQVSLAGERAIVLGPIRPGARD